ncbi:MAG TPA: amino acid adenylation domain-containing protein, partial [Pseudonocardiaceae bacterium]
LVGLCHGRRPELVIGVLGVLLAGAGYVPLDPAHPRRRLAGIAEDAGLRLVVADDACSDLLDGLGLDLVPVPGGATGTDLDADLDAVPPCPAGPADTAHVLYTSGSTGRPKGVVTTHGNVVAFAAVWGAETGVDAGTRTLGISSPAFDAFSFDVFVPLLAGGAVQLATEADRADPPSFHRFAAEHRVNWGFITPAVLDVLDPGELPSWTVVMVGGEVVDPALVARWTRLPGRRFLHVYGTTETTVIVTADELTGDWTGVLPIGRPLPNHRAYVVDAGLRPAAVGEPGELLIGGPGLAPGYLDRPGLTAERFVADPFSGEPGARLYRTGDVVRWRPDGRLEYVGRADGQVQVRGQRIELGEVEAALRSHPAVLHAVVEAVPVPGGLELVAFAAPAPGATVTADELREHCAARLTAAMVPARIVVREALPVNATTGKVDRGALLAGLDVTAPEPLPVAEPAEPLDDTQRAVAAAWSRVLGGGTPRADEDFFAAGGHSVAVMRLVAGVRAELATDITAEDVFAGRTVAGIAERVAKAAALPAGASAVRTGNPPTLSPSQRRLWFVDKLAPDSAAYNVAFAERLRGPLDVPALRAALRAVAERHDVLRWRIVDSGGVPAALCDPPSDVPLAVRDTTPEELDALLAADAATAFDLATGPVWRATLHRVGPQEHVLCLVLHHAVADGWSQAILYRDLAAAYAGEQPSPAAAGYADYAVWRAERDAAQGDADLAWWVEHLAGAPTVLDLPRDHARPAVQTYAGESAGVAFSAELDAAVRGLAADLGATPSLVLLAGFGQVLRRLTGERDAVVGMVVADRREAVFEDLVGFFVDIVPVRLTSDDGASFAGLVDRCLDEFLAVTGHPAAPLERIVDGLGVPRDVTRAPLVQVLFNVFNFAEPRLALPGLVTEPVPVAMPGSPFDLTVYLLERGGRFALDVVFNPDLYGRARVEALLDDYLALLEHLVRAADRPVSAVAPGLPDPARHRHTAPPDRPVPAAAPAPVGGSPERRTPTEHAVAGIWREVLNRADVGPADNFFDIGGHSLAIVAVQARLAERLGSDVTVVDLFRHPNVRGLAAFLDRAGEADDNPLLARAAQRGAARRGRATARARRPLTRGAGGNGALDAPYPGDGNTEENA